MLIVVIGSGSEVVRKIQLNNYKWKGLWAWHGLALSLWLKEERYGRKQERNGTLCVWAFASRGLDYDLYGPFQS